MWLPENYFDLPLLNPEIQSMRRIDYIYASNLGFLTEDGVKGGCRRCEFYRMRNTEKQPRSVESLRVGRYGEAVAEVEVDLAKKARIYVDDEVSVIDHKHRISGRVDLIIIDPAASSDPYIGIEHKSIWGYHSIKGTIVPDARGRFMPKIKHIAQTACYANILSGIKRWWIRYLCRDVAKTRKHELVILDNGRISVSGVDTGLSIQQIHAWADSVIAHVRTNTPPPRDFTPLYNKQQLKAAANRGEFGKTDANRISRNNKVYKGDFQCKYCDYSHTCWAGETLPYDMNIQQALEKLRK